MSRKMPTCYDRGVKKWLSQQKAFVSHKTLQKVDQKAPASSHPLLSPYSIHPVVGEMCRQELYAMSFLLVRRSSTLINYVQPPFSMQCDIFEARYWHNFPARSTSQASKSTPTTSLIAHPHP